MSDRVEGELSPARPIELGWTSREELKDWWRTGFRIPADADPGSLPAMPPVPLPWNWGLANAPEWVQRNAYAWHRMENETDWYRMSTGRVIDLRSTARRVFSVTGTVRTLDPRMPNDRHPDELYEFTGHGVSCPRHWFMVVAVTHTGLTAPLSVCRVEDVTGDDGSVRESRIPVMRTGYAHPSEEYACEVARQVHACERDAFAWDATAYTWVVWPVAYTTVYERTGAGWEPDAWREVRSYTDDNNRITHTVVPDTETT
jgi:hypothetical protein